jgi:hypothetical protein
VVLMRTGMVVWQVKDYHGQLAMRRIPAGFAI